MKDLYRQQDLKDPTAPTRPSSLAELQDAMGRKEWTCFIDDDLLSVMVRGTRHMVVLDDGIDPFESLPLEQRVMDALHDIDQLIHFDDSGTGRERPMEELTPALQAIKKMVSAGGIILGRDR